MNRKFFILVLFLSIYFWTTSKAFAEITYPYTLDEKPQVIFGDSAEIATSTIDQTASTTYQGLENYKQDYLNGFVRFSFTYTHDRGSYASYPPIAYITGEDPRETFLPTEKSKLDILDAPNFFWYSPTDWYLISVEFDSGGYNTIIKQGGVTEIANIRTDIPNLAESDWVALTNRYPRSGFSGTENPYSFSFTPVPIRENVNKKINPVIIVPGIMGSAKKNGILLIDPILHTYDDLLETLEANGYEEDKNLFTFPYEWRDSNMINANLLKDKISDVKQVCQNAKLNNQISQTLGETDCSKVDIVAHSMGGLISRAYIQSEGYQNDIDQIIFLGTPHKGSPKAYLQWEAGEFPPGFIQFLSQQFFMAEARRNGYTNLFDYIQNRPISSVQELLPIFDYLKEENTGILRIYPENYPRNIFLESLNTETGLSKLLNSKVKITNIVGDTGNNTIDKIVVAPTTEGDIWQHGKMQSLENGSGDGTVTAYGSTIEDSVENEIWNVSHGNLPRETSGRIFNILTGKIADQVIISSIVENIFSIHLQSPIDVIVVAPDGKRIGKNFANGEEYNEIPNAFYSGFNNGDEEYITIPDPIEGEYKIEVQGTGEGGEYGVVTGFVSENAYISTQAIGFIKPDQITELKVDLNDQGQITEPDKIITLEVFINDINGAYDSGWIKDRKVKDSLLRQAEKIIKLNKKFETIVEKLPDGSKRKKKVEKVEVKIDKVLAKLLNIELRILLKKEKINEQAFDLLKKDLYYLINN